MCSQAIRKLVYRLQSIFARSREVRTATTRLNSFSRFGSDFTFEWSTVGNPICSRKDPLSKSLFDRADARAIFIGSLPKYHDGRRGVITMTSRLTAPALRCAMNERGGWILNRQGTDVSTLRAQRCSPPASRQVPGFIRENVLAIQIGASLKKRKTSDSQSSFYSQLRCHRYDKRVQVPQEWIPLYDH